MSTPPNKPVRPSAPPAKAASPLPASPSARPPAAPTGLPSNRNLFIILGVAAAVLFLVLTVGLLLALVGGRGDSTASPTGPMFPGETTGAPAGTRLPRTPGPIAHTPRAAAEAFMYYLLIDDVGEAYNRTSESFQTTTTVDQFRQAIDLKPGLRRYSTLDLHPLGSENAVSVYYRGKVTGSRHGPVDFIIEVVKDRQGWAVREFSPE